LRSDRRCRPGLTTRRCASAGAWELLAGKAAEKVQARDRTDRSRAREGFAFDPDVSATDEGVVPVDIGATADQARGYRGDAADGPVREIETAPVDRKSSGKTAERRANDHAHAHALEHPALLILMS
jgi:hypothetical protein